MRRIRVHVPSPSTAIACLALLIALGGTSYAVVRLPAGSVGTKQLKKNAVTSAKVKNASLLRRDFKAGQLPAGPRGPTGPAGPAGARGATGERGPAGAAGAAGATNVTVRLGLDEVDSVATCQPGERATGGGGFVTELNAFLVDSSPTQASGTPTDWEAQAEDAVGTPATVIAYVICAAP